jgi:hypothetical protein
MKPHDDSEFILPLPCGPEMARIINRALIQLDPNDERRRQRLQNFDDAAATR